MRKEMRMDLETNAAGKHEILVSGSQRKPLVARTWSGRTRREHADEYLNYNYEDRKSTRLNSSHGYISYAVFCLKKKKKKNKNKKKVKKKKNNKNKMKKIKYNEHIEKY